MFHPATLLLAWAGFALVLPLLSLTTLAMLLALAMLVAAVFARRRTGTLLRRARWLLLSIALLFSFATPGLSLPGALGQIGMTQDGLILAAEHLARLLLLLTSLAVLHERLGTVGFVSGLHWLLGPLGVWPGLRERIVVRLMLVIEFVENAQPQGGWREWLGTADSGPQALRLAVHQPRWADWLGILIVVGGVGALLW